MRWIDPSLLILMDDGSCGGWSGVIILEFLGFACHLTSFIRRSFVAGGSAAAAAGGGAGGAAAGGGGAGGAGAAAGGGGLVGLVGLVARARVVSGGYG